MSFPWMLFITFLLSCGSAITTESSRGLHVAKNFSNGKNLSREVIYLSENEDAASNSNDDLGTRVILLFLNEVKSYVAVMLFLPSFQTVLENLA